MKIEEYETKTYKLTDVEKLDPITIFVKNTLRGNSNFGEITVRCWDKAWHATFDSIGNSTVEEYISRRDKEYLQENLHSFHEPFDYDRISKDIDQCIANDFEVGIHFKTICQFYGESLDPPYNIPRKPCTDQVYLTRISQAVIGAMKIITAQ